MSTLAIESQTLTRRKPDYAIHLVRDLLRHHPEYTPTERHVALVLAFFMGRKDDGWYHAWPKQGTGGALSKELNLKRDAIQRALKKLSREGGIFRCVPRYVTDERTGKRRRTTNDYTLIERPEAYAEARKRTPGEVVAFAALKAAAMQLCADFALWYVELRAGAAYLASRKDRREAMQLIKEYPDENYRRELLRAYLAQENDAALKVLPGHQARLLCDARRYLKVADELWRRSGVDFLPVEPAVAALLATLH